MQVKAKSKRMADLKAYLDAERARLRREILSAEVSTGEGPAGYGNHMADHATVVFEQAKGVGLRRSQELLLGEVEDALRRIADGSYGICLHCGEPIDLARLRAQPAASLCFSCQGHLETR